MPVTTLQLVEAPIPAGEPDRLNLADVMRRLPISARVLVKAVAASSGRDEVALSETSLRQLAANGTWPKRMTDPRRQMVRALITDACKAHGATPEDLLHLFEPAQPGQPTQTDPVTQPQEETPMLMAKQTLSPEARRAFGLFTNPFDGEVLSDDQMYTNGEIAYVREACLQAALGGRFVAIVGESGAGKTTIQADLEARILRDRKPVIVIKPWVLGMEENDTKGKTLKSTDILAAIVTTLDPLATVRQTLQGRSNQARDALIKSAEAGYDHLLVIEEAHSMPEATLKHLKRLHEMRMGRKPLLGILLLGQTELGLKLDPRRANLREVTQRCEVVHLMPLDSDLRSYLDHRASAAGKDLGSFIDQSGVDEIRTRLTITRPGGTAGRTVATSLLYPLAVNNLMTASLNLAAELGAGLVTRDVVRAV